MVLLQLQVQVRWLLAMALLLLTVGPLPLPLRGSLAQSPPFIKPVIVPSVEASAPIIVDSSLEHAGVSVPPLPKVLHCTLSQGGGRCKRAQPRRVSSGSPGEYFEMGHLGSQMSPDVS